MTASADMMSKQTIAPPTKIRAHRTVQQVIAQHINTQGESIDMQQHQAGRVIIPAIGINIIPLTRNEIYTHKARTCITHIPTHGSNPPVNTLSTNQSEQIHATYSGAKRSVIGRARIPIATHASMSPNVQQNPGHAINIPITAQDKTTCIIPQARANKVPVTRSA